MATDVILPALGMAQDTGKIVEWLKSEGERVTEGEPLVVIETDKAMVDLEAPATGVLARVSARAGDEVPVARVIAVILADGETPGTESDAAPGAAGTASNGPVDRSVAEHATDYAGANGRQGYTPASGPNVATQAATHNGRRAASPKARRMAAAQGLDIAAIAGTGPGGVVVAADVLAASAVVAARAEDARAGGGTMPVAVTTGMAAPTANATANATAVPNLAGEGGAAASMSTIWRLMADRTAASWSSVPHFFLARDVDASRLLAWREHALRHDTDQVTYTDLLVKVVADALHEHPRLNASWDAGTITSHADINIGLAVAVPEGLVVPVIHQADDLSLRGIARQRVDLVTRAQAGKLRLPDLMGGTFTISNLGMYGVDAFNAIINAPQAAILAVGRIADRVVPVAGVPAVRPMMTLCLSCDHRVVDGARGAQFLATVARLIEETPEGIG